VPHNILDVLARTSANGTLADPRKADKGSLFRTPEEAARQAVENDVHVVGISSLAGGHKTLLPRVVEELRQLDRGDIIVVIGGVIPPKDYEFLKANGACAIEGPGTVIPAAARAVLTEINLRLGHDAA
jgi:methylmalonyl-CoA mutase